MIGLLFPLMAALAGAEDNEELAYRRSRIPWLRHRPSREAIERKASAACASRRMAPGTPALAAGATARVPAASAPIVTIEDDFNDNSLNTSIWSVPNDPVTEQNGKLVMDINTTGFIWRQADAKTRLDGEDNAVIARVDFSNFSLSGTGYGYAALEMSLGQAYAEMEITDSSDHSTRYVFFYYWDGSSSVYDAYLTTSTYGQLMLVYNPSSRTIEGTLFDGSGGTIVGDSTGKNVDPSLGFRLNLFAYASNANLTVSFDNFSAQGGQYVPPQLGEKGLFERVTYPSGSQSRDFRMMVPSNYTASKPIALLFGFHGALGSTPQSEPYLEHLAYDYEPRAAQYYWITCSLSVAESSGGGWKGGWNNNNTDLPNNDDARAVQAAYNLLKAHYNIDDNRIYAQGHSSGGAFVDVLPYCLPDFLAVSCPSCPVGRSDQPAGSHHASIGTGGYTDQYNTDSRMTTLSEWYKANGSDADCYIFDMGHTYPPDDPTVSPSRDFADIAGAYFLEHPKNFMTQTYEPPSYATSFVDPFAGGPRAPDASRWRVELFDSTGRLFGPVKSDGSPGANVFGYKFQIADGWAQSQPIGSGLQGGVCMSGFVPKGQAWYSSFIMNVGGSDLVVWPVILRDMTGRVLYLNVTPSGWSWQLADRRLAFRSNYSSSINTLSSGSCPFAMGQQYRVVFAQLEASGWVIMDSAGVNLASGVFAAPYAGMNASQFGFGLRGTSASAKFDYAGFGLPQPDVSLDKPALVFETRDIRAGQSSSQTVTIANIGDEDLHFTGAGVQVAGPDAADFAFASSPTTAPLPAQQNRLVGIVFDPSTTGTKHAELIVTTDDPDSPVTTAPLSGVGALPEIAVDPLAPIDFCEWDPAAGQTTTQTVRIANDGAVDLHFTAGGVCLTGGDAGDFALALSASTSTAVAPGGAVEVNVVFSPTTTGTKTGALMITSDDVDESTVTVALCGAAKTGVPSLYVAPCDCLDFHRQIVATTSTIRTITLRNKGTADVNFTSGGFAIAGVHANEFFFDAPPSTAALASGASATIELRFIPQAEGSRSAVLQIASNDSRSTQVVELAGTSILPSSHADWLKYE